METVASADGTEIAFERTGSGPPLVLLHGGATADHTTWNLTGVGPAFAERHTVYAIDGRGRDESGDADEYALEREFEDVVAVVDSIDDPATLLGHSSGALISLEAALRTDDLRKLVLYEPPIQIGAHELVGGELLAEIESGLQDGANERVLETFLTEVAGLEPEEIAVLRSAPNWQDRVDNATLVPRSLRGVAEYEFDAARFVDTTTPTLLLAGVDSPPLFEEATRAVDEALPNSRVETFEGHQHMAMVTARDRFIETVLAFAR